MGLKHFKSIRELTQLFKSQSRFETNNFGSTIMLSRLITCTSRMSNPSMLMLGLQLPLLLISVERVDPADISWLLSTKVSINNEAIGFRFREFASSIVPSRFHSKLLHVEVDESQVQVVRTHDKSNLQNALTFLSSLLLITLKTTI